jgi:hypothetical protein
VFRLFETLKMGSTSSSQPAFLSSLQLFGVLVVVGAKSGIKDKCVESLVQTKPK